MSQKSPFKISQDLEIVSPQKGKAYPILVLDWNYIKGKIRQVKDTTNVYYMMGSVLVGASLTALLDWSTIDFPRNPQNEMLLREIICLAYAAITFISGAVLLISGRKLREIPTTRAHDVVEAMELIELRIQQEQGVAEGSIEETTVFFDNFQKFTDWYQYQKGTIVHSEELAHKGAFSLKKEQNTDPDGGYKLFQRKVGLGLIFSGWIYRPAGKATGLGDRLAIEDADFNGYGFAVDHKGKRVSIERRDGGKPGKNLGRRSVEPPQEEWYKFEFYLNAGGNFDLNLNDSSGKRLVSLSATDQTYSSFDRVVVHGGCPYYVDELKVDSL